MPSAATAKILIDTYRGAQLAVPNVDGSLGITPHLDVGNPASYITTLGSAYEPYFVPQLINGLPAARGGDLVPEQPCGLSAPPCQFEAFPGTVGWMAHYLTYSQQYFDDVRDDFFHWVFNVHARGRPKSPFPCLDSAGAGTTYSNGTRSFGAGTCTVGPNPDFHVPSGKLGIAQLPGGKAMVSTGLWDRVNFVGSSELVAITTLHELGHNGNLWHGGAAPIWIPTTRQTYIEPNCKPNHLSIMSYTFSMRGLRDHAGDLHFDYSRDVYNDIDDTMLGDGQIGPTPLRFQTAWFAPLVPGLGMEEVKRYCTGAKFPQTALGGGINSTANVPQRRLRVGLSHDGTVSRFGSIQKS